MGGKPGKPGKMQVLCLGTHFQKAERQAHWQGDTETWSQPKKKLPRHAITLCKPVKAPRVGGKTTPAVFDPVEILGKSKAACSLQHQLFFSELHSAWQFQNDFLSLGKKKSVPKDCGLGLGLCCLTHNHLGSRPQVPRCSQTPMVEFGLLWPGEWLDDTMNYLGTRKIWKELLKQWKQFRPI